MNERRYKFGRRNTLPSAAKDEMTAVQLANFQENGGRFRSAPGAPMSEREGAPKTVLVPDRFAGSTEDSWRRQFGQPLVSKPGMRSDQAWGLHGKEANPPAMPVRPVPQVDVQPQVFPPGLPQDTQAQAWDRSGKPVAVPGTTGAGPTKSGTSFASQYGTGFVRNATDPIVPYSINNPPDLSTPDGLMADAASTSQNFLGNISAAPAMGIPASSDWSGDFTDF